MTTTDLLERFLDPVAASLTPEVAQRIIDSRSDPELLARIKELGNKSSAGTLTEDEREEYRVYVTAGDLMATLKLKARDVLQQGQ